MQKLCSRRFKPVTKETKNIAYSENQKTVELIPVLFFFYNFKKHLKGFK